MKKKILTVLLGLLVAASAVFASGQQEGAAKGDLQPVKITFQTRSHGAGAKYEADIVNAFSESHPNNNLAGLGLRLTYSFIISLKLSTLVIIVAFALLVRSPI